MGKDVLHAVAGEEIGEFFDPLVVSEESLVSSITLEPQIISKPAVLEPDSVGPEIMPAITDNLAWGPEEIRNATDAENGDEQKKRTPRGTLEMLPYLHCFMVNATVQNAAHARLFWDGVLASHFIRIHHGGTETRRGKNTETRECRQPATAVCRHSLVLGMGRKRSQNRISSASH
jgi:hypothetical protein